MNANLDDFLAALARNSASAGVLVLLVLVVQQVFRNQLSPHWRCALWLLVVVRLLPFSFSSDASIFNLLPGWSADVSTAAITESPAADQAALLLNQAATPTLPIGASEEKAEAAIGFEFALDEPTAGFFATWTWAPIVFFGWLAGAVVLVSYVVAVSVALARSLARLKPLDAPDVLGVLHACCIQMGIPRVPVLIESAAVRTPALHGLLQPRLLLPLGFTATYSAREQQFVFLHELAHLRRRDLLLNWIMTSLQIVHWFNPLVWLGFARWRMDREIACDAAALEAAGAGSNRAYGETMLRLLQQFSVPHPSPGLVGILEDKRQLRRRMKMIAAFQPARRPFAAAGLLATLALVGLTDAQVVPTPIPASTSAEAPATPPDIVATPELTGPYVLFLVNGAETMLEESSPVERSLEQDVTDNLERGRTYVPELRGLTDEQKRAAPKWQRTAQTLHGLLQALSPGTAYRVVICRDANALTLGAGVQEGSAADARVIDAIARRLREQTPAGRFDLESAFRSMSGLANGLIPERIVLITDGLPTGGHDVSGGSSVTEAQRIKLFQSAAKALPPRIPVHTVLLPLAGDPGAPGLYWELANATRGALTCPARPGIEARTHLAFIVDSSGSMRDPNSGNLWPIVIDTIETALISDPQLVGVQLLDGDGRFLLGRRGTGMAGWLPNTPETRTSIQRLLREYKQDTVSNPVPGIYNALRFLNDEDTPNLRMGICVFGDEYNSRERADVALRRLDALNPRDASGRRPVTISAIGFPTTIRARLSMGNTGLRFANLMRLIAQEHDGAFVALADL